MTFALSTHLFHDARLTRAHVAEIKTNGFDDIEVFATRTHFDYHDDHVVQEFRGWTDALGMRVGSLHAPICASFVGGEWGRAFSNASTHQAKREEAVSETRRAIGAAAQLNCPLVVVHLGLPIGQSIPDGDNDARAVRQSLAQVTAAAAQAGIRLALEVIPNALSTPEALLAYFDDEAEDLGVDGVCLDFGHAHVMGSAPDFVETLAGYIITTHLHDNRGRKDDHLVPFAGTLEWDAALGSLWKIGYTDRLVFEVAAAGDGHVTLDRIVAARQRLQVILDELSEPFNFTVGE